VTRLVNNAAGGAPPLAKRADDTEPFFRHARAGRLVLPTCRVCGRAQEPGAGRCATCRSRELVWRVASRRASVHSAVTVWQPYHYAFSVPYTAALVRLEAGPLLIARPRPGVGAEPDDAVLVEFEPVADSVVAWLTATPR